MSLHLGVVDVVVGDWLLWCVPPFSGYVGVDVATICRFPVQLLHIILCYCKLVRTAVFNSHCLSFSHLFDFCLYHFGGPNFDLFICRLFYQSFNHRILKNLKQCLFTEICCIATSKNFWMFNFKTLPLCPNIWFNYRFSF